MRTTRVTIHLKIETPGLYRFGYADVDRIENVTNWQMGNNIFQGVADGDKYFYAENLYIDEAPILKVRQYISCGVGNLEIQSVTERILTRNPLETDWVDEITTSDDDTVNPLERDWTDEVTIESGAVLEIQSVTENILLTPLRDDWTSEITLEASLEILSITETPYHDFNEDFNEDFNT